MTAILPNGVTRERLMQVRVTLSRALSPTEALLLLNNGVDAGAFTKVDDFTYTRTVMFSGPGDPSTALQFVTKALHEGQAIAITPSFDITFSDPPRAEIIFIEDLVVTVGTGSFILMEDGTPMLMEDGTAILTEDQS